MFVVIAIVIVMVIAIVRQRTERTNVAKFVEVSEQIARFSEHQMTFDLNLLQRFHEALQHIYMHSTLASSSS